MTLKANVRLYGPTEMRDDGVTLTVDHNVDGITDADEINGEIWAYLGLGYPGDYFAHGQQSSSIDFRGTRADFVALRENVQSFIDENTLTVHAHALNDEGEKYEAFGEGFTNDEAVAAAIEKIRVETGDESYVMNEWEAA